MSTTRRRFLLQAGSAPLVLGLGACGSEPDWLGPALERMEREGRLGLVIRLPADPDRRCALGHALVDLLERRDLDVREMLLEADFLCLGDRAIRSLRGPSSGGGLLLIDARGTIMDACALEDPWDLGAQARRLLHGGSGERLEVRARAARTKCSPEAIEAFERSTRDPVADVDLARTHAASLVPLLVRERAQRDDLPRSEWAERVLAAHADSVEGRRSDFRLPYGAETRAGPRGGDPCCLERRRPPSSCMACGMAFVAPRAREFVRFLSR